MKQMRQTMEDFIDEKREGLITLAAWLYEHPEIAMQEKESSTYVGDYLRREGFEVEEHLAGMETAFKAVKKHGNGPRIAFLAEYDALPGIGHACGHHMIAAMSVGAAVGLSKALEVYEGEVAVFGTPAEETGEGKSFLVDQGVFQGYDAAMIIHPNGYTTLYPEMTAIGGMDFEFTGKPAHAGAYPYKGVNALDSVVLLYNNINALRQQLKDGTRVHGIILEAGTAANVIPDKGRVRLEFRAREQAYFDEVVEKVVNCAKAAALAAGCSLKYDWFEPVCQGLTHNKTLGAVMEGFMKEAGVYDNCDIQGGSTDVGNVSQALPTIHPMLCVTEKPLEVHTQEFRDATLLSFGRDRMILGMKLMADTGLTILENPKLLEDVRKEFNLSRNHISKG